MWFTNKGGPVKIRIGEPSDCYWATIRKGESVELSAEMGLHYGFSVKTTEGQIGTKKVETKQISVPQCPANVPKKAVQMNTDKNTDDYTADNLFFKELCKIKGIGKKTAKDIIDWGTKEKLIEVIEVGGSLPFRDDIENLLRRKYG